MDIELLRQEYQIQAHLVERLKTCLCDQIKQILIDHNIALGVPIESRVKSWSSLENKLDRRSFDLKKIADIDDLVGIRLILLFRRDLYTVSELLTKTFDVLSIEDTASRLSETQFGYQSLHHIIKLPNSWLEIPTFADLGDFKAEIQVRTLAQHIWAAASHRLQYKHEESIPLPIRRSIHRVSALLETIDLEFERVLAERDSYISKAETHRTDDELNVDLLSSVLSSLLPPENKTIEEAYADLLPDLFYFKINTVNKLRDVIQKHISTAIKEDKRQAIEAATNDDLKGLEPLMTRVKRGVLLAHVGLVREVMRQEFGAAFNDYMASRNQKN